jgi:hypothetical protein
VSLAAQGKRLSKTPTTSGLEVDRLTANNLAIIDQWAKRSVALQKMAPYLAMEMLYEGLLGLIPGDPAWFSYRRSLHKARVGPKSLMAYAVYARPTAGRDRPIEGRKEVLYIRPRRNRARPIAPEVEILAKYNPWTMSMLPFSPKRNQAVIVTRRASEREINSIERQRKRDRPQWRKDLQEVGVRNVQRTEPLKKVDTKVVEDVAFAGMRLEFGFGGTKRVPHWRPSIRAAIRATKRLFTKKSPYTKVMNSKVSSNAWKRWPPKVTERLSTNDLKSFAKFQKRLRTRPS